MLRAALRMEDDLSDKVVEALAPASAYLLIRRLRQTPLQPLKFFSCFLVS
jgi:hypothetical protein